MVEKLFLHPAILIASGFECLDSADVRFLNASKRHFNPRKDNFAQIRLITPIDFEFGGIFNPTNAMIDPIKGYRQAQERIPDFPYLNQYQILRHLYLERLEITFQKVTQEILETIKKTLGCNDLNIARLFDNPDTSTRAIKIMHNTDIYRQIHALHKCGVGNRLTDAFSWVFHKYLLNNLD